MDFIDNKLWKNCGIISGTKELVSASVMAINQYTFNVLWGV
jgi:hypothetical protein